MLGAKQAQHFLEKLVFSHSKIRSIFFTSFEMLSLILSDASFTFHSDSSAGLQFNLIYRKLMVFLIRTNCLILALLISAILKKLK